MSFEVIIATVCVELLIVGGWACHQLEQLRRAGARVPR